MKTKLKECSPAAGGSASAHLGPIRASGSKVSLAAGWKQLEVKVVNRQRSKQREKFFSRRSFEVLMFFRLRERERRRSRKRERLTDSLILVGETKEPLKNKNKNLNAEVKNGPAGSRRVRLTVPELQDQEEDPVLMLQRRHSI